MFAVSPSHPSSFERSLSHPLFPWNAEIDWDPRGPAGTCGGRGAHLFVLSPSDLLLLCLSHARLYGHWSMGRRKKADPYRPQRTQCVPPPAPPPRPPPSPGVFAWHRFFMSHIKCVHIHVCTCIKAAFENVAWLEMAPVLTCITTPGRGSGPDQFLRWPLEGNAYLIIPDGLAFKSFALFFPFKR